VPISRERLMTVLICQIRKREVSDKSEDEEGWASVRQAAGPGPTLGDGPRG